jgi:dTMP kinase
VTTAASSPTTGIFVVFEGGEGSGKTTQIARLAAFMRARNLTVVTTREPGGTVVGQSIRALLLDPATGELSPRTEALLYAADRAEHVASVITPALRNGDCHWTFTIACAKGFLI